MITNQVLEPGVNAVKSLFLIFLSKRFHLFHFFLIKFISILYFKRKYSKCLENKPKSELINETNINLPGLIYSLNKQCQLSNGANSSYCDNEENNIQVT
jgi:hypothetical protein